MKQLVAACYIRLRALPLPRTRGIIDDHLFALLWLGVKGKDSIGWTGSDTEDLGSTNSRASDPRMFS